jgi:hypothetical protein
VLKRERERERERERDSRERAREQGESENFRSAAAEPCFWGLAGSVLHESGLGWEQAKRTKVRRVLVPEWTARSNYRYIIG